MANTPITSLPVAAQLDPLAWLEIAAPVSLGSSTYVSKRAQAQQVANAFANQLPAMVEYVCDEGGTILEVGNKGFLQVPFAGTIQGVTLLGNASGDVEVDIWLCSYSAFNGTSVPSDANSIVGGDYPAISGGTKFTSTTMGLWSPAFNASDILSFYVRSCTAATRLTISLSCTRSVV